ncbi:MAG: DUF2132 domain-containing protein [Nannocystaceae bacterium]|nr:DUF2132 domain-containing protein [Nannocystaceae bacterium]
MSESSPKDPLHGITLKAIVEELVASRGWPDLAANVAIRCFSYEPSVKSSLKFLRKTEWARAEVEALYLEDQRRAERNRVRNRRRAAMRAYRVANEATGDGDLGDDSDVDEGRDGDGLAGGDAVDASSDDTDPLNS